MSMNFLKLTALICSTLYLAGCNWRSMGTNGTDRDDRPFIVTTQLTQVKKLALPVGTHLYYTECISIFQKLPDGERVVTGTVAGSCRKGQQIEFMNEARLDTIHLPKGQTIDWNGIPVSYVKLYEVSSSIRIDVDYETMTHGEKEKLKKISKDTCFPSFDFNLKNMDDLSFNPYNISSIKECLKGNDPPFMSANTR